jgi:hypothetical protein
MPTAAHDQINWLIPFQGPEGLPLLTYGNYGGQGWSGGKYVTDPGPGDPTITDPLDALFAAHDAAYDDPDPADRAAADVTLIQGIRALPEDAVTGEGDLYGGMAILLFLYQIAFVHDHPELLRQLDFENTVEDALDLIEHGGIQPAPEEQVGLVNWLTTLGNALAGSDNPIAQDLSEDFLDFVAALGSAPATEFQDVLKDETHDFLDDFASHLEDAVEALVDPALFEEPEQCLDVRAVVSWLEDRFPNLPTLPEIKVALLEHGDFHL